MIGLFQRLFKIKSKEYKKYIQLDKKKRIISFNYCVWSNTYPQYNSRNFGILK